MRLWHKDLIEVLPRQQLLSQWRECCCIARNIKVNGTPNHILVNKVLNYSTEHFEAYICLVVKEMKKRGYKVNIGCISKYYPDGFICVSNSDMFDGWHNDRYLKQCFYNLQEKYDCGGISQEEWNKICENKKVKKVCFMC